MSEEMCHGLPALVTFEIVHLLGYSVYSVIVSTRISSVSNFGVVRLWDSGSGE